MRGPETQKHHQRRIDSGFYDKYMQGVGLDIGWRGSDKTTEPVLPTSIGIDTDYPGYDGKKLPFPDQSQDYIFNSHCLEHIDDYKAVIRDWFRVLKTNGHLIIIVPHQYLYERKLSKPSIWNRGHKRFYSPASLLKEIEDSLEPNTYRIRHLRDNDDKFNYNIIPPSHPCGGYEIELVLQKINPPTWKMS